MTTAKAPHPVIAFASRFEPHVFAILRIVGGGLLSCHGMQKVFGWFTSHAQPALFSQLWFGGMIELLCGLAIAIGLCARPAAFLASGTMAVAYFQFHWKLAFEGYKFLPVVNNGELAVLNCFLFLYIVVHGAGIWSVDAHRNRSS